MSCTFCIPNIVSQVIDLQVGCRRGVTAKEAAQDTAVMSAYFSVGGREIRAGLNLQTLEFVTGVPQMPLDLAVQRFFNPQPVCFVLLDSSVSLRFGDLASSSVLLVLAVSDK